MFCGVSLGWEVSLCNKQLFFIFHELRRYVTFVVSERRVRELHCVALCLGILHFCPCCNFVSTMVSFGSAPLEQSPSRGIPDPEPLPKPVLDAISQAVVMAMEKRTNDHEKNKRKARSPSRSISSSSTTHPSHTFERGKNTLLHNIHKSVQPPTFSGGANIKPAAVLSFLGTVKNLFEEELSDKEKLRAFFFFERTSPPLVDLC